jgi:hypothetical protein
MQDTAIREIYEKNGWTLYCVMKEDHLKMWTKQEEAEDLSLRAAAVAQPAPLPAVDINHPDDQCPACFCKPCCTHNDNRQLWWPDVNVPPNRINRSLRLRVYKYFWAMLLNRGVWKQQRYLDRKTRAMDLDPRLKNYEWHKREIMPDCVIKTVRAWYPNMDGESYIGHQWETPVEIVPQALQ